MQYFDAVEFLEPKCPKCGTILDYGITTEYDDIEMAHVCRCGQVLK